MWYLILSIPDICTLTYFDLTYVIKHLAPALGNADGIPFGIAKVIVSETPFEFDNFSDEFDSSRDSGTSLSGYSNDKKESQLANFITKWNRKICMSIMLIRLMCLK